MTHIDPRTFEQILIDPSVNYAFPEDVLHDNRLTRDEKILVLKQWAFDEREIEVAEEENMRGGAGPIMLDEVMLALRQIQGGK